MEDLDKLCVKTGLEMGGKARATAHEYIQVHSRTRAVLTGKLLKSELWYGKPKVNGATCPVGSLHGIMEVSRNQCETVFINQSLQMVHWFKATPFVFLWQSKGSQIPVVFKEGMAERKSQLC